MINFNKLGIDTNGRTSGRMKVYCPKCRDGRKNKRDKSLSVNLDNGMYNCHYCGFKGCAKEKENNYGNGFRSVYDKYKSARPSTSGLPTAPTDTTIIQWFTQIRHVPLEALTALGVTTSEQYMPQTGKKEPCICFNYFEKGSRAVYII